jgi:acyl carrier protein
VERTKAIEEIRGLGVDVTVVEGDVASEADMRALFRRFDGEFPPLRGIFHVATVVDGTKIADVTDAKLEAMLRAKVAGTWVLHELTKTLPLDFFVAFSSTPAILGSKGMAHYAAANQFLDTFAHTRRAMGLPMLSVDWGSWDVLRLVSAREQAWLAETGLLPMPTEKALDFMETLIRSSRAQVMIADIDWKILKPLFEANRRRPMLEKLGGAQDGHPAVAAVSQVANLRAAMEMTSEDRKRFVEAFVMEQAAQVLGLRHGERPPLDVPLTDMGLDSLMAVDLKNRLQIGLGQELSPTVVFDYPTVAAMAEMLETMLWAGYGGAHDEFASAREDVIHI